MNVEAEIGSHYQQSKFIPYFELGLLADSEVNRAKLSMGTNIDLDIYSSLTYEYHFIKFPLSPNFIWKKRVNLSQNSTSFYVGTDIDYWMNKNNLNRLEHSINVGYSMKFTKFPPHIYLQYGYEIDYLNEDALNIYPVFQLGFKMHFKIRH